MIGTEPIAENWDTIPIDNIDEKIDICLFQELCLIDDDGIIVEIFIALFSDEILDKFTLCLKSDTRNNAIISITSIDFWFEKKGILSFFEVVVAYHEGICCFGASHSSIAKVEFCHKKKNY